MPGRWVLIGQLVLLWITAWAVLACIYRRTLEQSPPGDRRAVPVGWIVIFGLLPFPMLWVKRHFGEADATYWSVLLQFGWLQMAALTAWLWVTVRERRQHRLDRE